MIIKDKKMKRIKKNKYSTSSMKKILEGHNIFNIRKTITNETIELPKKGYLLRFLNCDATMNKTDYL